jgi:hypothetical protein
VERILESPKLVYCQGVVSVGKLPKLLLCEIVRKNDSNRHRRAPVEARSHPSAAEVIEKIGFERFKTLLLD